ncbi:MAG: AraC family transcriptional regulator [Acholeplasmatales bacterium]|nr:AraC family transcriptional regulator [Acholeplasmatales bacterium]
MFTTKDSIKFMMAKIFFNLANFNINVITEITPLMYHGQKTAEINYVRSGNGMVEIDGKQVKIKHGSYFCIPEFVKYSVIPSSPIELYSIYLLLDTKTAYKEYLPYTKAVYVGDNKDLDYLFDSLLYEFSTMRFGYNEIVVSNFKSIIVKILRNEQITGKRLSHWTNDSMQFEIEEIISNEFKNITINSLANKLHLSTRELQRYILKNYNKTFNELKTEAKMSYASNKLLYTDTSISDLANLVGYSSLEHFSYAFKKFYGLTPSEYRKQKKI